MISRRAFAVAVSTALHARPADRRALILTRASALAGFAGQTIAEADVETLEKAGKIARGTVFFYSRKPVEVGLSNIDWTGGHIAHQEWPAQLNRFFYLVQLASAYRSTKLERYAAAARAYIEDWLRGESYDSAAAFRPGDSGLNMSIRLGTSCHPGWCGVLPVFLSSPAFDDAFLDRMLASVARQAGFLSRHLSARGNWRISELDTLVFTALRLPFLPNAQPLLDLGIQGMRNALATQFLPDGVHNERTPGYHNWMTEVAVNYCDLARRFPEADARVDAARTALSLDYGAHSELFGVNDAMAPHRDPVALTRLQARRKAFDTMRVAGRFPAEPHLDQVFASAGQVFSRSAWAPGADYLAFDASSWGGGHSHLSRLSFVFRSGGRMLVADPGILTYEMSDPMGAYGKSTPAHTTLNVDGWNQSGADAQLLRAEFARHNVLIHARYQGGYWNGRYSWRFSPGHGEGVYGEHERILFWIRGEYLVVIDSMTTEAGREIRNCWQMGPMEKWSQDAESLCWRSENRDANVLLQLALAPAGTSMQCFEGSREPLRGWVGQHGDDSVPAPAVEFRYPSAPGEPVVTAALLVPFAGQTKPGYRVKLRPASNGGDQHLEIGHPNGITDHIAWTRSLALPIEDARPFTTDARLVWTRSDHSRRYLLDGSYLKFNS
jgi:hypothetical protein